MTTLVLDGHVAHWWPAEHERIIVTIPIRSWLDHLAAQVQTLPLTPATTATLGVWRSGGQRVERPNSSFSAGAGWGRPPLEV